MLVLVPVLRGLPFIVRVRLFYIMTVFGLLRVSTFVHQLKFSYPIFIYTSELFFNIIKQLILTTKKHMSHKK